MSDLLENLNYEAQAMPARIENPAALLHKFAKLEARPYGSDSTEDEIQAIKDCCYLYQDDIVVFHEVSVQSVFELDLFFEKLKQLSADFSQFYLLVDLTEAGRPNAEIRDHLRKRLNEFDNLRHIALFTGRNFMLNIAAKFVFNGSVNISVSVHKTLEEALEAIYAQK